MSAYPEFVPFSILAFVTGTLVYAFREFYIIMDNIVKSEDGITGYLNYGFWTQGNATTNPSRELVRAVLRNMDPSNATLVRRAKESESDDGDDDGCSSVEILEIGCGLGQPAIDAAHHFGPQARITGISINQGHVTRANDLAKSKKMESRISHHVLNATSVYTLPNRPFGAAYSVETLSEIPDPDLRRSLAAIHEILLPGADFAFADIIRSDAKPFALANAKSSSSFSRYVSTEVATRLWGDDWRTLSTFCELLNRTGFDVVSVESVGDRVFVPTWIYAKQRMAESPSMGLDYATVGWRSWYMPMLMRFLARFSLKGMSLLWESGEIDYVIVRVKRRP